MERPVDDSSTELLWIIPQVRRALGLGRNKIIRTDIYRRAFSPKFGRAVRVSRVALQRWLEQREQQIS